MPTYYGDNSGGWDKMEYTYSDDAKNKKDKKSSDISFWIVVIVTIIFFGAALFWSYKEYKNAKKARDASANETITEIPYTLVAVDAVGSAKYENYYIYLEDGNGNVRQFSVSNSDYSAINFKYKVNDSVVVTNKGGLSYLDECYLSMGRTVSNNKETNLLRK